MSACHPKRTSAGPSLSGVPIIFRNGHVAVDLGFRSVMVIRIARPLTRPLGGHPLPRRGEGLGWHAEQVVFVAVFDAGRDDVALLKPASVAQVDFAIDLGRVGL